MDTRYLLEGCWKYVLRLLPAEWETLARETKAVERFREIPSVEVLLQLLFMHLGLGYSLRETAARGQIGNLADVSDVALLKRLRKAGNYFRQLCLALLREQQRQPPDFMTGELPVRLVDATHVKEPGKTGSSWRMHVAIRLSDLECDYFEVTPATGKGTGETFTRIPIQPGECIMGDRAYGRVAGLAYVQNCGGFSVARIASNFPMEDAQGKRIELLDYMRTLKKPGDCKEWPVFIRHEGQVIPDRLCAVYKSQDAVDRASRKVVGRSKRKRQKLSPDTIELARFMMIFTTVPEDRLPLENALELYRFRWQIELLFKRFKSLAQLGHLPKTEKESAKAWLYGKMLICLLTEKAIARAKSFSPWGLVVPGQAAPEQVAGVQIYASSVAELDNAISVAR
ncbi:MAG: IS4 family transposase [Magnetococcales bacterium]|nr:IS4 family transposase [Magnetococcales bacterium]